MNVDIAAYHTVHDHAGGSASLAPMLAMREAVLNSKVNPRVATHHVSLAEAVKLMELTGDHRILFAMAGRFGYVLDKLPDVAPESDLASLLLDRSTADGSFAGLIREAIADGEITAREMDALAQGGHEVQGTVLRLLAELRRLQRKPAPEGA